MLTTHLRVAPTVKVVLYKKDKARSGLRCQISKFYWLLLAYGSNLTVKCLLRLVGTDGHGTLPALIFCRLYIQGVSRLVVITAGGDFLGLCDQKSSYKHVSDFRRLRSYGHFLIPHTPSCEPRLTEPAGGVMYSTWWLIVCVASIMCVTWLAQFTTERQPVLRPLVVFSKTSFKHRSIQIKGNLTKLTLHLYFKCIMYYAGLLFCSVYCQ